MPIPDNAHPAHSTKSHATSTMTWFVAGVFFTVLGVVFLAGGDSIPGLILSMAGIVVLAVVILHTWRQQ